jgi:hypothetical protein
VLCRAQYVQDHDKPSDLFDASASDCQRRTNTSLTNAVTVELLPAAAADRGLLYKSAKVFTNHRNVSYDFTGSWAAYVVRIEPHFITVLYFVKFMSS